jgi:hypothetical protein
MADIGPGHITTDQHRVWIVRTDGRVKHRAPAPRSNNLEVTGTRSAAAANGQQKNDGKLK